MAHVINLISIANLDGNITEEEKNLIFQIANTFGLTEEEFQFCVETSTKSEGKVFYEVPETDEDKTYYLKNLTMMMMVDGQIDEIEKEYIKIVAEKFGYDGDKALDILIKSVYEDFKDAGDNENKKEGDGRMSQEEFEAETKRLTALGKEALINHEISKAFDYLFVPAHFDTEALKLFLMIPDTHTRMYLLSDGQIARVKEYAENGYAVSQYVYGRYHQLLMPDKDSIEIAIKMLEDAAKVGVSDATCALSFLYEGGRYGMVDKEKAHNLLVEAYDHNSAMAARTLLRRNVYGNHGWDSIPEKVISVIKDWLKGNESDDISVVNPIYYEVLGDAYASIGDKENAETYYLKAADMGYVEALNGYCSLYTEGVDIESESQVGMYEAMLTTGCEAGDPGCYILRAAFHMDNYDSYDAEKQEEITEAIKEDLETAMTLGHDMAPYFLGQAYYYGNYGFEEDNTEAWNYFVEGTRRDDSYAYSMIAQMIIDGTQPGELQEGMLEYCQLNALRFGDDDQLKNVVEAYRSGKLTYAAAEIEKYYIPKYDSMPQEDDDEDEEDDEQDYDDSDYKLIAVVKTNGTADIMEFDVEAGWDELPELVGAHRLDAIRVQPLYDIGNDLGMTDHITGWVDNMGLMKDLPMNPIGCKIYPGPIAGDMILTLEDKKYNPKSFESLQQLKDVVAALGANLKNIILDDGPDDDGRFDAYA